MKVKSTKVKPTTKPPTDAKPVIAVRCIHKHPDGLTRGKTYNVVGESEQYYDIQPDDYGHLSGFDKRFFEAVSIER